MPLVDPVDFTCPVCDSRRARWVAENHGLRVARCLECGHASVWPLPSADFLDSIYRGRSYYEGADGAIGFCDYASLEPARGRMFSRHLTRIEGEVAVGRILDVGCANGDFLEVARARGWEVYGADPSAARPQVEAKGIKLVGTTVRDADIEEGSLDAVTFWDVLEHVPDPVADLSRARKLLKPRGVLALTVPDASNLVARLSGRRWFGFKTAGEHLQFFTPTSLAKAFARAGLSVSVRRGTTWSCTIGFLADRAGLYMGAPGRAARGLLSRARLASIVVDVPQINQFAMGVPAVAAPDRTPAGVAG